jgi:hypothetical protein
MSTRIAFIDTRVAEYQVLIDGLDPGTEYYLIDQASDGLDQIASLLQGRTGIDALHIISHGSSGSVLLGSSVIDSAALATHASQLHSIGQSLTESADILLYGCNVGAGATGLQFIGDLALATRADVAGSNDLTGASLYGANAELEVTYGDLSTPVLLSQQILDSFSFVLATKPVTTLSLLPMIDAGNDKDWETVSGSRDAVYDIRYVVVHTTWLNPIGGSSTGGTALSNINFWKSGDGDPSSAHYIIDSGNIYQTVDDNNVAYHAGQYSYNKQSIGIEIVATASVSGTISSAELVACADLTRWLCQTYNIPTTHPAGNDNNADSYMLPAGIIGHDQISLSGKTDPGPYFDWSSFISLVTSGAAPQLPDLDARNDGTNNDGTSFAATLSASSVAQGTSVTMTYRVSNWGPANAGPSTTGIYRSANNVFDANDTLLTTDSVSSLNANVGSTETVIFSTSGIAAGTYYIFAVADHNKSIAEADDTNNPSNGVALTITAPTAPEIAVSGNGTNIVDGDTTPATTDHTDFGTVTQNGTAISRTFTVSNTGNATLTTSGLSVPTGFSVTDPLAATINAGGFDTFTVRLDTTTAGTKSNDISFTTNDSNENPFNFSITGTVSAPTSPEIAVSGNGTNIVDGDTTPTTTDHTDFGTATQNGSVISRTFTVSNTGNATLTTSGLSVPTGFSVTDPLAATINAGGFDTFTVRLDTTTAGTKSNDITFTTNDSNENPFNFSITGTVALGITARDFNGDHKSDILFRANASGALLQHQKDGFATTTAAWMPVLQDPAWTVVGTGDYNGDGKSDILLGNASTGGLIQYQMNGSAVLGAAWIGSPGAGFKVVGSGDYNGDGMSDLLFRNSNGALLMHQMNGFAIANAAWVSTILDTAWNVVGNGDYNGDRKSDILLGNASTGGLIEYQMNGAAVSAAAWITTPGAGFKVVGNGDYNSDGKSDILFRSDASGGLLMHQMNGFAVSNAAWTPTILSTDWTVVGNDDYNGDGKSDILMGNASTGGLIEYQMNGAASTAAAWIGTPGTGFKVVGEGQPYKAAHDFNGDGKSDILFRNAAGSVLEHQKDGFATTATAWMPSPGADWFAVGTGDYNGDGKSDLLYRNSTTGGLIEFQMNGASVIGSAWVGSPGASFQVVGNGDYNGDGKSDLLFRNAAGAVLEYQMNGTTITSSAWMPSPGADWNVAGTGDYNGDGKSDLLFRNTTTGGLIEFQMNGASVIGSAWVGSPGANFKVVGNGDYNGDGKSDILFRSDASGGLLMHQMNGFAVSSAAWAPTILSTAWNVVGNDDYNGDGKSDILMGNSTTGGLIEYQMNGAAVSASAFIASPGAGWVVQ